jgi:hypothetical protein
MSSDDTLADWATVVNVQRRYGIDVNWGWFMEDTHDLQLRTGMSFEQAAEAVAEVWVEVNKVSFWQLLWEDVKRWFHR